MEDRFRPKSMPCPGIMMWKLVKEQRLEKAIGLLCTMMHTGKESPL